MKELFKIETPNLVLVAKTEPDAMKMFLDAEARSSKGEGSALPLITRKDLLEALTPRVAIDETHLPVIDDVAQRLSRGEKVTDRRIARGTPAEPGADGKLLLLVKKFTGTPDKKNDDKSALSDLHLFDNVQQGQIIGRVYPPKAGVPGKDVTGKVLAAPAGKPSKVTFDKTLALTRPPGKETFEVLVAQQAGLLKDDNGRLTITDQLVLADGLDLHFGNIDFVGSVVVRGDVAPGLSIRAGKGIEVKGNIRGGKFVCPGGDIIVRGFLYGGPGNQVLSGRNISLRVAQAAEVEALGDITVEKEVAQCTLRVGASLFMPAGKLIGGECLVVCGVEARVIGNEAGLKTMIRLGSDVESTADYGRLLSEIANHARAIELMKLHLGPLARDPSRMKILQPAHRIQMERMLTKLRQVEQSKHQLLARQQKMLAEAKHNPVQRVNAHQVVHGGVVVHRGKVAFEVKDDIKGPVTIEFNNDKQEFESGPLKPLECSFTKSDDNAKDSKKGGAHGK